MGAPGGTTSSIIGVGAYVSPTMAAGTHNLVEAPPEGLEYTWYVIFWFPKKSNFWPNCILLVLTSIADFLIRINKYRRFEME